MQYTRLGHTGLQVSRICLGTMTFGWSADETVSHQILDAAFEHGVNFIDTADVYSRWIEGNDGGVSETIIGNWMQQRDRRQVIVATKARGRMWEGPNGEGLSRHHIIQAAEDSLRRLQTDYIDLYQTHFYDENTPIEETLTALDHLVHSGKVRYVGCSNYPAWRLVESLWQSDVNHLVRYKSIQPHYSVFNRKEFEAETQAVCSQYHIGIIPYSPLAGGFATGKYTRDNRTPDTTRQSSGIVQRLVDDEQAYVTMDVMQAVASEHSVPVAQIALAWLMQQPAVDAPIIGARKVGQLTDVVGASDIELSAEQVQRITEASAEF